jgi:hypothetical protein
VSFYMFADGQGTARDMLVRAQKEGGLSCGA